MINSYRSFKTLQNLIIFKGISYKYTFKKTMNLIFIANLLTQSIVLFSFRTSTQIKEQKDHYQKTNNVYFAVL